MKGNSGIIYLKEISEQLPRLLGLLDRNPLSCTYGCFDRQYWHYRTVDFAGGRYQEAVLTLALLYHEKGTKYYQDPLFLEWINAALDFWAHIQARNGTFSEWWPHENSFVATAFSSYAVSETLLLMGDKIKNRKNILEALKKSCRWLANKTENTVQNQQFGMIVALYNAYLLTNDIWYKEAANKKIENLSKQQTSEGWFYEYGGPDIGYLSLTIDYLAKYYKKSKDKTALDMANKSVDFISHFVHPNFTFGGEYASRNTEYMIPHGFELLSRQNSKAAAIATAIKEATKKKTTVTPRNLDDRYLCYIGYTWIQAYQDTTGKKGSLKIPEFTRFQESGLAIYNTPKYFMVVNTKKGGAFKLFFKNSKKVVYDSGLQIKYKNKKYTSALLSEKNIYAIDESMVRVMGHLGKIKTQIMTPVRNILSREFQTFIGRFQPIAALTKTILRKIVITFNKASKYKFTREIILGDTVYIEDAVQDLKNIDEIIVAGKASYNYIPSSRYFQHSELDSEQIILRYTKKNKFYREYNSKGNLEFSTKPLYRE